MLYYSYDSFKLYFENPHYKIPFVHVDNLPIKTTKELLHRDQHEDLVKYLKELQ